MPSPEDLVLQVEELKKILPLMGIPVYVMEGYEADDIIYTLSTAIKETKKVLILTKDKDIYQIINDKNL